MQDFFHCVWPLRTPFSAAEGEEKKKVGNPIRKSHQRMGWMPQLPVSTSCCTVLLVKLNSTLLSLVFTPRALPLITDLAD